MIKTLTQQDIATYPQPSQGWEQFYSSLAGAGNVPDASITRITAENAVFYNNYLDIGEVQKQIITSGSTPPVITIYTDILNVNGLVAWQLTDNTSLVIYARIVQFTTGASFYVNFNVSSPNAVADFMIFSTNTNGEIIVNTGDGSSGALTITSSGISPGTGVTFNQAKGLQSRELTLAEGFPLTITSEQEAYLFNSYIFAALCSNQHPDIAVAILLWVNGWAGASVSTNASDLSQLYFASSSLASLFQAQMIAAQSGATYVPFLSKSVYANLATSMANALQNDEQNYITLFTAANASSDFIQAAQAMQSVYSNDVQKYTQLFDQASTDYNNALVAEQTAELNFKKQQAQVIILGNTLQANINDYVDRKKAEAVLTIGGAIITFTVGVAGIITGNEETAPLAAEGATAAAGATELASTMNDLKKVAKIIEKLYDLAQAIFSASQTLSTPDAPVSSSTSAQAAAINQYDAINGVAAWSVFQIQADSNMISVIDLSIDGSQAYKDALDILVVYGQALLAARLAVIQASQKAVSLSVELAYARKNANKIQQLVSSLIAGETQILQLQQLFYQQSLNTQLALFSVLKSYQATYLYWALQPSSLTVSLYNIQQITSNLDTSVNLTLDDYQALISIEPQTMNFVEVNITDPHVIGVLNSTGEAQWVLNLDHPSFSGLDRVRFTCVRIWLVGDNLYAGGTVMTTVSININTSGNYQDRYRDRQFQFNSAAFNKRFEYYVNDVGSTRPAYSFGDNLFGTIVLDGSAAPGTGNDYFEPTPFSEWSISLNGLGNSIPITKITKIVMQFQGSAIAET